MKIQEYILLTLLVGLATSTPVPARHREADGCGDNFVAKYNLTVETFWAKEVFTKQYPLFRPHAQWSKLVGRSHADVYTMWKLGEVSKPAVKEFAERGDSSLLDQEAQGTLGVLDSFSAGPIDAGVGMASSKFLVDADHSKLSAMMRIVPSPDWFIGIDNLDLCAGGRWLQTYTKDLAPHDAGTDRGFTFTAPNWPETPHRPVSLITSKVPNHPANSFFYPEWEELPSIARISLERVELETTPAEPSSRESPEAVAINEREIPQPKTPAPRQPLVAMRASTPILRTRTRQEVHTTRRANPIKPEVVSTTTRITTSSTAEPTPANRREEKKNRRRARKNRKNRKSRKNGADLRVHCEVGPWSVWGPCSKTCGFGTRLRIRTATVEPMNGGMPCPPLREEQICGSMRSCGWNHFSFSSWNTGDRS